MFTAAAPDRPNPAPAPGLDPGVDPGVTLRLPADAYYHLVRTLCLALPPPSGNPEHLLQRNHAAIAGVAALCPANAAEANLAADVVIATEQGRDCLRLAQLPETAPEMAAKCRAEARSMMREAKGALRLLLKLQEARRKRDSDSAACNSAAWMEHSAIHLMAEALSPQHAMRAPPAPCEPAPAKAGDTGIAEPPPMPQPQPGPEPVEEFEPDLVAEAEHYAVLYPERAALIRRIGRVPHNASFGPPDDDLVQALVTARSPALAALDREYAQARAA